MPSSSEIQATLCLCGGLIRLLTSALTASLYRRINHVLKPPDVLIIGVTTVLKPGELIPWDEQENDYAAQFCKGFGAPAKAFRMALGALIIKASMVLKDEKLIEQNKENPYLQFFIGLLSQYYRYLEL